MRRLVICISMILLFTQIVHAQALACPDVVAQALADLGQNCDGIDRNTACYGYNLVESSFSSPMPDNFFSQPADRADLTDFEAIRTTSFDQNAGTWGIAVLEVQANVPNILPGQAVTMLLMGNTEVINDVSAPFTPIEPIDVLLAQQTEAYLQPASLSVDVIPTGTTLPADAQSVNGAWVRVVFDARPVWVARDALTENAQLDALPVLDNTPMQAFYFTGGIGTPACAEAPDTMTIQSPDGMYVDLTINGLDVRIGSTITLHQLAGDMLGLTVREGSLQTPLQTVYTGETLVAALGADNSIIGIEEVRPATEAELAFGDVANDAFEQIIAPETANGEIIHIVVRGDTLFSIARQYDASMPVIIQRNNLNDPSNIFIGQELIIPNPGSGFVGLPEDAAPSNTVACADFRVISPTDGLAFGLNTFTWTEVSGATSYRLSVQNLTEIGNATFDIPAPAHSTSVNLDHQAVGWGFDFSWKLEALVNGNPVCDAGIVTMQRGSNDNAVPAGLAATWSCAGSNYSVIINYGGAQAGEVLTISFYNIYDASYKTLTVTGASGSVTVDGFAYMLFSGVNNGELTDTSGITVNVSPVSLGACP